MGPHGADRVASNLPIFLRVKLREQARNNAANGLVSISSRIEYSARRKWKHRDQLIHTQAPPPPSDCKAPSSVTRAQPASQRAKRMFALATWPRLSIT